MKRNSVRKECSNCGYKDFLENELHNPLNCVRCQTKKLEHWVKKQSKKKATVEQVRKLVNNVRTWRPDEVKNCRNCQYETIDDYKEPCNSCLGSGHENWKPKATEKRDEGKIVYYCPSQDNYMTSPCTPKRLKECSVYSNIIIKRCNEQFKLIPMEG